MKQMILTGLATEQSFSNKGEAQYYLVFNHGELRVPVTEEAAREVVSAMVQTNGHSVEEEPQESHETYYNNQEEAFADDDGDGVDQV